MICDWCGKDKPRSQFTTGLDEPVCKECRAGYRAQQADLEAEHEHRHQHAIGAALGFDKE